MDLSYPVDAFGFSSSWREADSFEAAMNWPSVGMRRCVTLGRGQSAVVCALFSDGESITENLTRTFGETLPTKFKRTSPADVGIDAISSGAGSALLKLADRVIKIKRCGFGHSGVGVYTGEVLSTNVIGAHIVDVQVVTTSGAMGLASAATEIAMVSELQKLGLCDAYRPIGLYVLLDQPASLGAAVVEVASDFRADEFIFAALAPALLELMEDRQLVFDRHTRRFQPSSLKYSRRLESEGPIESLGEIIGGAFRTLYANGFCRGRGSCWFGNEVVQPTGISLVDLDGGTADVRDLRASDRKVLREIEVAEYQASVWGYLGWGMPLLFASNARAFVGGFRRGLRYGASETTVLPIHSVLNAYSLVKEGIRHHIAEASA